MNTELLFQTINSVNQLSIYVAVKNKCYKWAWTRQKKEHMVTHVNNRVLAVVENEEVEMLISFPNLAQKNLIR